jgi:hypothetical protein
VGAPSRRSEEGGPCGGGRSAHNGGGVGAAVAAWLGGVKRPSVHEWWPRRRDRVGSCGRTRCAVG